ncbi:MAG: glycoside hydrolase family 25 protein [Pontixanthobacter sp.]
MGRGRRKPNWLLRLAAALTLIGIGVGAWFWWDLQHWTPDEAEYPDQGALVSAANGAVAFETLKALGADFAYLAASDGAGDSDAAFARNFAAARRAGVDVGAVHRFDPCILADRQTANFVTIVPRTEAMLPPVIALDRTAEECPNRVSDAAVESELTTLINQIENHSGKPAILKVDRAFEAAYGISARLDRNLWVTRTRFAPTYTRRPWLLWSANLHVQTQAADTPLEWVVVQP